MQTPWKWILLPMAPGRTEGSRCCDVHLSLSAGCRPVHGTAGAPWNVRALSKPAVHIWRAVVRRNQTKQQGCRFNAGTKEGNMKTTGTQTRIQLRNILYCTDFSDAAANALPFAAGFARHFGSRLYGLFVRPAEADRWEVPAPKEFTEANARKSISQQFAQFPEIQNEILIGEGDPWPSVESVIKGKEIDLVVIGTRGRTGLGKLLLGSAAEEIFRRTPCAVLTVGPHAPSQPSKEGEI